jgi:hypothetical protein
LNAEQRHLLKVAELQLFAKQYARPAQRGAEPNDRRYGRAVEAKVKRMPPDQLDELLRGDD